MRRIFCTTQREENRKNKVTLKKIEEKNGQLQLPRCWNDGKDGFKLACKDLEVKKMAMGEESAMPRG